MNEREFALQVVQRLQEAGYQTLWAGGCVRDELLGIQPKDYDVATAARPEEVRGLFRRTIAVGMSFGVVEVLGPRLDGDFLKIQVATFRADGEYSDGRHPDKVTFCSAREDALRRDFTVNGMFKDPIKDELLDYVGGQEDLKAGVLRAIGDPFARFEEDKLRMVRAARFATRFRLAIDPATADAARQMAHLVPEVVSAERIAEEFRKLLVDPERVRGVGLLVDLHLLEPLLPELGTLVDTSRWSIILKVLGTLGPSPSFPLAFAGLLSEMAERLDEPQQAVQRYEALSRAENMTEGICLRLKLSNAEKDRTCWLVANQRVLANARTMRLSRIKRVLVHDGIRELLALHRAKAVAVDESLQEVEYCEHLLDTLSMEELDPAPLITGADLIQRGLKPGPMFRDLLEKVRDEQLEGTIATFDEAMVVVSQILDERAGG
ncbi:MAG: CCA tRNA nucleotidyltransferase [Gemmataceae bacterium]